MKYSVDLSKDEIDTVLTALSMVHEDMKDEEKRHNFGKLMDRIAATPAFDNPIVLGHKGLMQMVSSAINFISTGPSKLCLSGKQLEQQEITKIALAHSFLMWLNSENNLKRIVLFDYTDDSNEYESNDDLI